MWSECEEVSAPTGSTSRKRTREHSTTTCYQKKSQIDGSPVGWGGGDISGGVFAQR